MYYLDLSGAAFSLLATYLYVNVDQRAWFVSVIAIAINAYLYFQIGIYGDMTLEGIYFISILYGWYTWMYGGKNHQKKMVTHIQMKHAVVLAGIACVSIPSLALFLKVQLHSQVPWLDAITTVISLLAQWLLCRKIIETWCLWFIVDALYVGLYFYKGIPFHGAIFFIYLGMALIGFWRWQQQRYQALTVTSPTFG